MESIWTKVHFEKLKQEQGGVDYPAALSFSVPYPVSCGAAPAVPAARYCKRSIGFARLLSLPQNGIPLRQGTDGGDRDPAFREERRVHRVPREEAASQLTAGDQAEHRLGA